MEDFVEDFSTDNEKYNIKEIIIDSEDNSVMKKQDLISDKLDDLLR